MSCFLGSAPALKKLGTAADKIKVMNTSMINAVAILATVATTAGAQSLCGDRDGMVAGLSSKYGETSRLMAIDADGGLIEFFASDARGGWTVIRTNTSGVSCIVSSGNGFEIFAAGDPV